MMATRKNKVNEGSIGVTILIYSLVTIACFFTLYPFYFVFIQSFAAPKDVVAGTVYLWPREYYFESYKLLLNNSKMWVAFSYSILYAVLGTTINITTSILGAYPLSVKGLAFKRFWVFYILIPMYFGGGLIPTFIQMTKLGLYNNIWAIIIPSGFSIWNIILVRTNMMTVPDALRESAIIDGAGHFRILSAIIIPLIKPVLAVIAIYSVVGIWNSWFNVLLYLPNTDLHPLQFYLYRVMIQQTVDLSTLANTLDLESVYDRVLSNFQLKYALIIVSSLPMILTYPFFQKYFVKGVMLGSLKG